MPQCTAVRTTGYVLPFRGSRSWRALETAVVWGGVVAWPCHAHGRVQDEGIACAPPHVECSATPNELWNGAHRPLATDVSQVYHPPPLSKLRPCLSYSRRRDRINLVPNFNSVPNLVQPHKTWV